MQCSGMVAYEINTMRQFLIDSAETPQEKKWAMKIPWQPLMEGGLVDNLTLQVKDLKKAADTLLQDAMGFFADKEKLRAENEKLRAEKDALREENERLRAENERLLAHNRGLFADNQQLFVDNQQFCALPALIKRLIETRP